MAVCLKSSSSYDRWFVGDADEIIEFTAWCEANLPGKGQEWEWSQVLGQWAVVGRQPDHAVLEKFYAKYDEDDARALWGEYLRKFQPTSASNAEYLRTRRIGRFSPASMAAIYAAGLIRPMSEAQNPVPNPDPTS